MNERNFRNNFQMIANSLDAIKIFIAALMAFILVQLTLATAAGAASLVINNVGNPTVVGTGVGKRAIWTNAGTVGATTVDLVAVYINAGLNQNFVTVSSRPTISSVGQDDAWVRWYIYKAGTFNVTTGLGGVAVVADVHVQFNDIDGPNNEEVFVPICAGDVQWIRIDSNATTGRNFGTVGSYAETFSLMARILVKDAESNRGKSNKSRYFFSAENSLRCHKLLNQGCCHPR